MGKHSGGGCRPGIAVRLISEVMEEMGLSEKLIAVVDVACSSLNIETWRFDTIMAAHSIGMAETMHTAIRNDNIITIVIKTRFMA